MAKKSAISSVQSHTEYTHGRFRCRRCGAVIPTDAVDGALCVDCQQSD
ncbi:hypothetical protein [Halobellus clavatus]|uniref:Uncharacterized protein n=1 Tax=Halobellus clavatus TaxID=660517 RepID=A0A1H3DJG5_9EURY|nr:hypothetical protein [Halobellus clavatus]SDX66470.1 hypothetical protein SAMN04487946_101609 [Halobellus clavatus]